MYKNAAAKRNETDVNDLIVKLFKIVLMLLVLAALLNFSGVISIPWLYFSVAAGISGIACVLPIVYRQLRIGSKVLKYINTYSTSVLMILCYICLQRNAVMLLLVPICLAASYFDGRLIVHSVVLAVLGLAAGEYLEGILGWNIPSYLYTGYYPTISYIIQIAVIGFMLYSIQKRANKMLFNTQSFYKNIDDLFSNAYATSQNLQSAEEKLLQEVNSLVAGDGKGEELDAGVKSIITGINRTVENAKEIAKYTQTMLKASNDSGNSGLIKEADSEKIEEYSKKSKESIAILAKYTERIKEDLSLLSIIIDESKLLSVNAAMEAENANSGGKGSAILAMKVEKLADQSVESASHIQEVLSSIVHDAESTVKSVTETYEEVLKSLELINRTVDTLIKWLMYKNMN